MNLTDNKLVLLNQKPRKFWIIILLSFLIMLIILGYMMKKEVYDNYQGKGYVTCDKECVINTVIPSNIEIDALKINNRKVKYEIIDSEMKVDQENMISYQSLVLKIDKTLNSNEIVFLTFYYNKQSLLLKVKDLMW